VSGDASARAISDLLFRRGSTRLAAPPAAPPRSLDADLSFASKGLHKFLSALASHESPVLVDLGPVVGSNISFFGERLGCKIFVEDVFTDLDRHFRDGRLDEFPQFLSGRFSRPDGGVDGILVWDVFDYLERAAAAVLARQLARMLSPGGVLLGLFGTARVPEAAYTKYLIRDDLSCERVSYGAAPGRQPVLQNREILRLFEGLLVSDSFLLKINTREMLFRRPVPQGGGRSPE
jgi:hypothetical protein